MNGHPVTDLPARPPNPGVVATLEELLTRARAGEVVSLGVVYSCGPGHLDLKINAQWPLELYLGCDMLKQTLFNLITKPPAPSKVLRPFGGL